MHNLKEIRKDFLKFDKNHIYYQIIFNGTPNIFLKLMKDKNFVFSTLSKTWILQ